MRKRWFIGPQDREERRLKDVVGAHAPEPFVDPLEDGECVLRDELGVVAGRELQGVNAHGPVVLWADEDHIRDPGAGDPRKQALDQITFRIEHRDAASRADVLGRQIEKCGRLAGAVRAE